MNQIDAIPKLWVVWVKIYAVSGEAMNNKMLF